MVFDSTPENDTLATGSEVKMKCNSTELFLEPDTVGNNTLSLVCGDDGKFADLPTAPESWPSCVVKCEVNQISSELGFKPITHGK